MSYYREVGYYDFTNEKYPEKEIREFIEKYPKSVDFHFWERISKCQTLSEDFIREFQDKLNWYKVSQYQNLSEGFLIEFIEKIKIYEWLSINLVEGKYIASKPDSGGLMDNKLIPEEVKDRIINLKKVINSS